MEENYVKVYYNTANPKDPEALVYARELSDEVVDVDLHHEALTEKQLEDILEHLQLDVHDIIDKKSDLYHEKYKDKEFSLEDWLKIMVHEPELIKTPIAFWGNIGIVCDIPSQILRLDDDAV